MQSTEAPNSAQIKPVKAEMSTIKRIERLSKLEVHRILRSAGIRQGSGDLRDYEQAKRIIFSDEWIDGSVYDKQIRWIAEYMKI